MSALNQPSLGMVLWPPSQASASLYQLHLNYQAVCVCNTRMSRVDETRLHSSPLHISSSLQGMGKLLLFIHNY